MLIKSKSFTFSLRTALVAAAALCLHHQAEANTINLGTAGDFAVLGGATVTNTGPTIINGGNLGVNPGSAITGFPPGIVTAPFTTHAGDAVASQAQADLTAAYNEAAGMAPGTTVSDLTGFVLSPGVYTSASSVGLAVGGLLTLDGMGDSNALFVFQVGSALTTGSGSSILLINGADAGNVFWQVGSSATLGTDSYFAGHILALTSITLATGASLDGSALASFGSVTMDTNTINHWVYDDASAVPDAASTLLLVVVGLATLLGVRRPSVSLG